MIKRVAYTKAPKINASKVKSRKLYYWIQPGNFKIPKNVS